MSDSVGQYLNEIGLVPLLTAAEERELSQIIEKGVAARQRLEDGEKGIELKRADRKAAEAKDRFIRANLRLVVSVARRYPLPAGMELLDLIQEGNLGLEHAVDKFDWRKGFKFSTYATFWIRQAIGRALDQKASLVRLPGDRSASLRAALRQVSGDGDAAVTVMHAGSGDGVCAVSPGVGVRKMHSTRRDAFQMVNGERISEITITREILIVSNILCTNLIFICRGYIVRISPRKIDN